MLLAIPITVALTIGGGGGVGDLPTEHRRTQTPTEPRDWSKDVMFPRMLMIFFVCSSSILQSQHFSQNIPEPLIEVLQRLLDSTGPFFAARP